MENDLYYLTSAILIILGFSGAISRRNLLSITLSFHVAVLGFTLFFSTLFGPEPTVNQNLFLSLVVIGFALISTVACGLMLFTYRNQSTLNIDEIQQLRG